MYNEIIKNQYLNELPTSALKSIYASIFKRTDVMEEQLEKDIFSFDLKDCIDLLLFLSPKSVSAIKTFKSQIGKYVDWAIENRISLESKNYWLIVPVDDDFIKASFKNRYIKDLDELIELVDIGIASNYDKCVVYLLYMGIMGENCDEIIELQRTNVDERSNTITTKRRVYNEIIEPLYDIIKRDEYDIEEKKGRDEESIYFIKPYNSIRLKGKPINPYYIYRVFIKMNENIYESTNERRNFVPMTIWRSGLFNSLYKIEQAKNSLTNDDYIQVCKIYGKDTSDISVIANLSREYRVYKEVFWS